MNATETVTLNDGRKALRKTNDAAPAGFFQAEAAGLVALADGEFRVPEIVDVSERVLLLEWIEPGRPAGDSWETAGRALADLHTRRAQAFGFDCDTFCGDTRQNNRIEEDGYRFYRERRYRPQIERAASRGLISHAEAEGLEQVIGRLEQWIPEQDPVLLHGDLWSGNLMFDSAGRPVIIDPACYWGWPEADLAMTHAFGGFSPAFYRAYEAAHPLEPGFEQRIDLYNLYHWLNHLNLFGGAYYGQVMRVLNEYG